MKIKAGLYAVSASLLAACGGVPTTVGFEHFEVDSKYVNGEVLTEQLVFMTVGAYFLDEKDAYDNGSVVVDAGKLCAGAKSKQLFISNANVHLANTTSLDLIRLEFNYMGGSMNLIVNGELAVVDSLSELPVALGGVTLSCEGACDGSNGTGALLVSGTIDSFAIGGQELCLDNIEGL